MNVSMFLFMFWFDFDLFFVLFVLLMHDGMYDVTCRIEIFKLRYFRVFEITIVFCYSHIS